MRNFEFKIPPELLLLHPNLSRDEIKTIIRPILTARRSKIRSSQVFYLNVPHIGVFKSHKNKKRKSHNKLKTRDRKRKKVKKKQKDLTPEKLLF